MADDFTARVTGALGNVEHEPNCAREIGCPILMCDHSRAEHACTCDREDRIGAKIAKMVRALHENHKAIYKEGCEDCALRVLGAHD